VGSGKEKGKKVRYLERLIVSDGTVEVLASTVPGRIYVSATNVAKCTITT